MNSLFAILGAEAAKFAGIDATAEAVSAEPKPVFVVIRSTRPINEQKAQTLQKAWSHFQKLSPAIPPACVVGPEIEIEVKRETT